MEEKKGTGFFGQIKNQIITAVSVILATLGTLFTDIVKDKLGLSDTEKTATEQVAQPTQDIIINIPEQKKDTVVKKVYVKPVVKKTQTEKRKAQGLDW